MKKKNRAIALFMALNVLYVSGLNVYANIPQSQTEIMLVQEMPEIINDTSQMTPEQVSRYVESILKMYEDKSIEELNDLIDDIAYQMEYSSQEKINTIANDSADLSPLQNAWIFAATVAAKKGYPCAAPGICNAFKGF